MFFIFTPISGRFPNWLNFFQMGWNHQPGLHRHWRWLVPTLSSTQTSHMMTPALALWVGPRRRKGTCGSVHGPWVTPRKPVLFHQVEATICDPRKLREQLVAGRYQCLEHVSQQGEESLQHQADHRGWQVHCDSLRPKEKGMGSSGHWWISAVHHQMGLPLAWILCTFGWRDLGDASGKGLRQILRQLW